MTLYQGASKEKKIEDKVPSEIAGPDSKHFEWPPIPYDDALHMVMY